MHSNFQLLLFVKDQERSLSEKLLDNILDSLYDDLHNCNRLTPLGKKKDKEKSMVSYTGEQRCDHVCTPHNDAQRYYLKKKKQRRKSNTEDQIIFSKIICLQNAWEYL